MHMIKAYIAGQQTDWDLYLGVLAGAYRSSVHETTGLTPNQVIFGQEVRSPSHLYFGLPTEATDAVNYGDYVLKLRERLTTAQHLVRKNLETKLLRQKVVYDRKQILHEYKVGDLVWWFTHFRQLNITPKLRTPYDGPFLIVGKTSPINYAIQTSEKGSVKNVHHNKLKRYEGTVKFQWAQKAIDEYVARK